MIIVERHVEILEDAVEAIKTIPPETDDDRERAATGDDPRVDGPVLAAWDAAGVIVDRLVIDDALEAGAARDRIADALRTRDPDAVVDEVLVALLLSDAIIDDNPLALDPDLRAEFTTKISADMLAAIERAIARRGEVAS